MDWVTLLEVIGGLAVALMTWIGVRWIQPRLRPRAKLKTDLEILRLLDHEKQKEDYELVEKHIDRTITELYAPPIKKLKPSRAINKGVIALGVTGFIGLIGFSYWTWYIVSDGFSWWSIMTGYFAFVSFAVIMRTIEWLYKPPRKTRQTKV